MKSYSVKIYNSKNYAIWNEFVAKAKNATFLFHRDFMDYHNDRFQDFSLLVFDEKENLKAILPANRVEDVVFSHQGLTYGGLVINQKAKLSEAINIFKTVLQFLAENEIKTLEIKQLPSIYTVFPSDEIEYLAFLCEAQHFRTDILSVINMETHILYSRDRKQAIKRGNAKDLKITEVPTFDEFWNENLIPNLEKKHKAKPVHTLEEITLLKRKFPKNIRQFNVYLDDKIVAGTTIFETKNVAHSQYISGNSDKNQLASLDILHHYLLTDVFANKKYFDFGISNENQGKNLNNGLLYWKESFGARTITQSFYRFETKNFSKLEKVLR